MSEALFLTNEFNTDQYEARKQYTVSGGLHYRFYVDETGCGNRNKDMRYV